MGSSNLFNTGNLVINVTTLLNRSYHHPKTLSQLRRSKELKVKWIRQPFPEIRINEEEWFQTNNRDSSERLCCQPHPTAEYVMQTANYLNVCLELKHTFVLPTSSAQTILVSLLRPRSSTSFWREPKDDPTKLSTQEAHMMKIMFRFLRFIYHNSRLDIVVFAFAMMILGQTRKKANLKDNQINNQENFYYWQFLLLRISPFPKW